MVSGRSYSRRGIPRGGQAGASMVEYAVILGALIVAFLFFGTLLSQMANSRADKSSIVVQQMVPCNPDPDAGGLLGQTEEECM